MPFFLVVVAALVCFVGVMMTILSISDAFNGRPSKKMLTWGVCCAICGGILTILWFGNWADPSEQSSYLPSNDGHPRAGAVVVTPEPPLEEPKSAYGRVLIQEDGAYFVEVNEEWLYVIPDEVCRAMTDSERDRANAEIKDLKEAMWEDSRKSIVLIGPMGRIPPKPEQQAKSLELLYRLLDTLYVPRDVQSYLNKVKGIPLAPEREPKAIEDPPQYRAMT